MGWEDPLKEGVATHSSTLAWIIPWTEGPGGLWPIGHKSRTCLQQLSIAPDHGIQSHHLMAIRGVNKGNSNKTFSWASKSLQMVTAAMKLRHLLLGRKGVINLDSILKSRAIPLPTNVRLVKAMAFPVVMCGCELDCKGSAPKT